MPSCCLKTRVGLVTVEWNGSGVTRLHLPGEGAPVMASHPPLGLSDMAPPWLEPLRMQIERYFAGSPQSAMHGVPVDLAGLSPFAQRALRYIKEHLAIGATMSYGALASAMGSPGAARAVGRAMAINPIPLVIPCHRVVRADGALGGYSGGCGPATKRLLLDIEESKISPK